MTTPLSPKRFDELTQSFAKLQPIFVAGDLGIDKYTFGEVRRISPEAPVPVVEVTREWLKLGLAANISHNLRTLGIDSLLCGVVGQDVNAAKFESLLEESGLKTWGVVRCDDRPTIFKERITTDTQQICRVDYEQIKPLSAESEQRLIDRLREFSSDHGALIIEDYAKGSLSEGLIQELIQEFKGQKKLVCVDPGTTTPPQYYRGASLLKPNLKEARLMASALGLKTQAVEDVALALVDKLKLERLAITLGPEGIAIVDTQLDGRVERVPTIPTEVYDVSGAGDTAISLLCAGLMSGATLKEAAWLANCGSGVVVGKKGTATVNLEELKRFYLRLYDTHGPSGT